MPMPDQTSNSLHARVVQALGSRIIDGSLKPGDVVASDGVIAQSFSASRTAMREAVRVLTAKGLLESRPRLGTRVRSSENWNVLDPDVLAWKHAVGAPGWRRDLVEMRRMIEPQAAALAAERADEATLCRLSALLDRMEQSTRGHATEDGIAADIAFHSAILAATGNQMISSLRYAVSAALRVSLSYTREDLLLAALPAHRRVLKAITSRRPAAARRAMEALIDLADHDLRVQSSPDESALDRR